MATQMGSEFILSLNRGDICAACAAHPGAPASRKRSRCRPSFERTVKAFPEVDKIFAKIGTAEVATDPMPPNVADNFVMLKPQSEWPDPKRSKAGSGGRHSSGGRKAAGNNYEFTQPIQMHASTNSSRAFAAMWRSKSLVTTWMS